MEEKQEEKNSVAIELRLSSYKRAANDARLGDSRSGGGYN